MRKHILSMLSIFTAIALLSSCGAQRKDAGTNTNSTSSAVSSSGPSASQWRNGVKGNWVLSSVTRQDIPQSYTIKNIFDEAPVDCFIGSVWNLPTGNYKGSITFNSAGTLCANGAVRTIIWSIFNPKDGGEPEFQFKKLYAGDKAANVTTGYRLGLMFADGQTLTMKMPVPLDNGTTGHLVLNFTKQAN
ncbi:MAG TPA: hypothetical protein VK023_02940 [Sphingobacterium bovisgrunnientis]|uniref:hypothetical protein n=1 Tax=Sphingobacterium bovisgrunnientis TaxID=1874697 RepID=UPI00135B672B|nr:hypothetical protein [Sphingobacterium bovisgrunnientis]HLS37204.1 hypothetical protein [Sphingobacterium bovisgrunnientis]